MSPEFEQEIFNLLRQERRAEAKSLAFQHFGNLTEANQFIESLSKGDKHVLTLIAEDKYIEAVKFVREREGWGLKESKDYVDKLRGLA